MSRPLTIQLDVYVPKQERRLACKYLLALLAKRKRILPIDEPGASPEPGRVSIAHGAKRPDVPRTKASEMSKTTGQAGCLAWIGTSLDSRFGAAKSGAIFAVQ